MTGYHKVHPMTPLTREDWLFKITAQASLRLRDRYRAGQEEHECDLGTVSTTELMGELEREIMDSYLYLQELRRRQLSSEGLVAVNRTTLSTLIRHSESSVLEKDLEYKSAMKYANQALFNQP